MQVNLEKNFDIVVVGAGLSGLTAARTLAEHNKRVLVVEKRGCVGGNAFDYRDGEIVVQKYGPHIFHTSNKRVFEFLSRFTEWVPYKHKVLGLIDEKLVPVPFNLTSLEILLPSRAQRIKSLLIGEFGMGTKVSVVKLINHYEPEIKQFGEYVYQKVFFFYTQKQWGMPPDELDEAVSRVPVNISYEDGYFSDEFQFMPTLGFSALCSSMARHPNIELVYADALDLLKLEDGDVKLLSAKLDCLIYTGRLDDLFGRKYGQLKYRSLDFVFETHDVSSYQPAAVVNYTTSEPFTRISEFTKFTCPESHRTIIVKEFSKPCLNGDEPYYPIPRQADEAHYERYAIEARKYPSLYLLGRLATYKYVNMDVAVLRALELCDFLEETWTK